MEKAIENSADIEGDGRKAKSVPCRYCSKRFRRLEHAQRHERTHTKEKPYRCGCGKMFGRRDLLVRHERLIHQVESSSRGPNSINATPHNPLNSPTQSRIADHVQFGTRLDQDLGSTRGQVLSPQMDHKSGYTSDNMVPQRTPGYSLDLLSDAAHHLASDAYNHNHLSRSMATAESRINTSQETNRDVPSYPIGVDEDTTMRNSDSHHVDQQGPLEDYNLFLDDVGINSNFFSAFDTNIPVSFWSRPTMTESTGPLDDSRLSTLESQDERNSFSRFGSRLPSLQPEQRDASLDGPRTPDESTQNGLPWMISARDHHIIKSKLDDFSSVLPKGFQLPLRRTMSRYLEGYISGFHEHMPCLHIPTLAPANCAPELFLALVAIGAQYRFENYRGNRLWYAARAVALEQVQRRNTQQVLDITSPPSSHKTETPGQTPQSGRNTESRTAVDMSSMLGGRNSNPVIDTPQARLETIQALFLLMAMGTWGPRALVREALSLRSQLYLLVRDEGLTGGYTSQEDPSWEAWIQLESEKRTKFIVYYFFNLHCIAYDLAPPIMSSELNLSLPCSAKEWRADNAGKWRDLRKVTAPVDIYFQDALSRLFTKSDEINTAPPTSSLGNYILISAIIQQIYFVRKTSIWSFPSTMNNNLRTEDIDGLSRALRAWQVSWERTPESSLEPNNPNGPVAFNSTALLRIAYIRLHVDLGPYRHLEARDPARNARAFKDFPPLKRSPHIIRAVLQSAHALSIPVKIGIAFVARTQTFSWSIQHSLCNLECAFLLSKWLETIAASAGDLTTEERTLLDMVRNMVDETELAIPLEPEDDEGPVDEGARIMKLGAAVVRLWAETFKGTHIFEIVKVIGQSLDMYADLLETADDQAIGWSHTPNMLSKSLS